MFCTQYKANPKQKCLKVRERGFVGGQQYNSQRVISQFHQRFLKLSKCLKLKLSVFKIHQKNLKVVIIIWKTEINQSKIGAITEEALDFLKYVFVFLNFQCDNSYRVFITVFWLYWLIHMCWASQFKLPFCYVIVQFCIISLSEKIIYFKKEKSFTQVWKVSRWPD